MKTGSLFFILILLGNIGLSQQQDGAFLVTYPKIGNGHLLNDLDFVHCTVGFTVQHMGWSQVSGIFTKFKGAVVYDEQAIESLAVTFAIDVNSINTNQNWRDKDLKSEKWFNSTEHPNILFQSKRVDNHASRFDLTGDLSIKGVTREIQLSMDPPSGYFKSYLGQELAFNGSVVINRKDFNIGENTWWNDIVEGVAQLSDEVTVKLSIIFQLQSAEFLKSRFFENERQIYEEIISKDVKSGLKIFDKQKKEYDLLDENNVESFSAITYMDLNAVGNALILEGRPQEAKELFVYNQKSFPNSDEAIIPEALLEVKHNNYPRALKLSERALQLNPDNVVALELLRQLK